MYWCCGSTKKESPGCLKTKHASKDDEEFHTADHPVKPRETCTGCKISGHSSHSCPKDPNPNSFSDLKTEAIKARNSVRRRTRIGQLNFDTSNKLINVLRKRNKSANKENSFRDISSLRNHLTVDSSYNKISIDEVVLEENHMKSPTRSRTIPSRSTEIDTKYAPDYIDDKFSREFIEMLSQ